MAITRGRSVADALLNISTISFWTEHKGTWFIAMLIPLYAITPVHDWILKKIKYPQLYTLLMLIAIEGLSCIHVQIANDYVTNIIDNIRHVVVHLPPFFIGYMFAPMAKEQRCVSSVWMLITPLIIMIAMKVLHIGYWPVFLVFIFLPILCWGIKHCGKAIDSILSFFGIISLESYLLNGAVGSWLIAYLPMIYFSPLNKGCYLHYALVCVIGTMLAYMAHKLCKILFFRY